MRLNTLERFDNIVIQTHDNPDADAVGSGYALYRYFQSKGKKVRLVYGGALKIAKSNMQLMINELDIPIEYINELDNPELLLMVDCQYGEGNVQCFEAQNIAMIDHHSTGKASDDMVEIRSNVSSCSTICYDMLRSEGFDVNEDIRIATALYYGLYMDSNQLSEIGHPLDLDLVEGLKINRQLIRKFTHANFTLQELETAGIALVRYNYNESKRLSIIKSRPCDPNILGLIGDLVLQVDSIDVSVIFNECPGGYKLSVRSCIAEVAANEMAEFLTEGIGNGGGHLDKAGGFISGKKFKKLYDNQEIEAYFFSRVDEYYESYDIIYAKDGLDNCDEFRSYRTLPYVYGYVKTSDMFPEGTQCRIRTYEGDVYVTVEEDNYLILGYHGEVSPISKKVFEEKYQKADEPYINKFEYSPSIMKLDGNKMYEIIPYMKKCISLPGMEIYAKQLEKPVKVFTKWNEEKYIYGIAGDYICYPAEDKTDIYILKEEEFKNTHK